MRPLAFAALAACLALTACTPAAQKPDDANARQQETGIASGTPAPAPAPAATPPATAAPSASQSPAGSPHKISVEFTSPNLAGEQIMSKPGAIETITAKICNQGDKPIADYKIKLMGGDFAALVDPKYADYTPGTGILPAGGQCATQAVTYNFQFKMSDAVKPGTSVNVSPVLAMMFEGEAINFQPQFTIVIKGPATDQPSPVAPTPLPTKPPAPPT